MRSPSRCETWLCSLASDLVSDPPFLRLDLVSCRNVLIYSSARLQAKVLQTFHFGLVESGCLFLGRSESVAHADTLYAAIDRRERLFRQIWRIDATASGGADTDPQDTIAKAGPQC